MHATHGCASNGTTAVFETDDAGSTPATRTRIWGSSSTGRTQRSERSRLIVRIDPPLPRSRIRLVTFARCLRALGQFDSGRDRQLGLVVKREDAALAPRRSGFDSLRVHKQIRACRSTGGCWLRTPAMPVRFRSGPRMLAKDVWVHRLAVNQEERVRFSLQAPIDLSHSWPSSQARGCNPRLPRCKSERVLQPTIGISSPRGETAPTMRPCRVRFPGSRRRRRHRSMPSTGSAHLGVKSL